MVTKELARRPTIMRELDLNHKLHKIYYNQGCKLYYSNYDVYSEGSHAFVPALAFKDVKFCWEGENFRSLDIPTDEFNSRGFDLHKNILEHNG